jgi:hypothetical protein
LSQGVSVLEVLDNRAVVMVFEQRLSVLEGLDNRSVVRVFEHGDLGFRGL